MECKLKNTGHIGNIKIEGDDYYGIYWYGGIDGEIHAKNIREKGHPHYFQNKSDIELLKPTK
jgi:hypothetical protein